MRKSNTLGGKIDKLELCEAELQSEITRLKSLNCISPTAFDSISNALDRRNTAMKSLKRLLF